jgi:hypothetical protein
MQFCQTCGHIRTFDRGELEGLEDHELRGLINSLGIAELPEGHHALGGGVKLQLVTRIMELAEMLVRGGGGEEDRGGEGGVEGKDNAGLDANLISTYVLPSGEILGLCSDHPCAWLLELLQSDDIHADDHALLGKDFVVHNLEAKLI